MNLPVLYKKRTTCTPPQVSMSSFSSYQEWERGDTSLSMWFWVFGTMLYWCGPIYLLICGFCRYTKNSTKCSKYSNGKVIKRLIPATEDEISIYKTQGRNMFVAAGVMLVCLITLSIFSEICK